MYLNDNMGYPHQNTGQSMKTFKKGCKENYLCINREIYRQH